MRSKLSDNKVVSVKTGSGRWIQLVPDTTGSYCLYEPLPELPLGRLLFDQEDNWIYDGDLLDVNEQEDVASVISGCQREMDELLKTIKRG
ncbi:hypothetical protein MTO98_07555 [Mucilaginibacter sp. SMC90]|uniref:hypothetical protein n=1 Tax=Mucilaginibacter sp. SMC90 TaxID=2929803 RepID=UPI001FB1EA05|nr:hypothetical protein [Mucilaginibacter sp. SMC90]UOE50932.1 hypothetical protein MTO98_07555 [Mucilaginibacter sp. SMC90]